MSKNYYQSGALAAEQLIKGWNLTVLPIDPFAIAREREIIVEAKSTSNAGVSGMLIVKQHAELST